MPSNKTVYVGTIGQGIWRSPDSGDSWDRLSGGLYMESDIRAIAVHPQAPHIMYAGTEEGCYKTEDGGDHWHHLPSAMDQTPIWALAIHPERPETIFAGTRPSALYRSNDAGKTWEKLDARIETDCPPIMHTRVTCVLIDPADNETIWAGVEIDGVYRSTDGGTTWTRHIEGLNSLDIHGIAVIPGETKTLLAATNAGVCKSVDNGETWQDLHVEDIFPWGYCRAATPSANGSGRVFIGNGSGPPGDGGSVQWTDDAGGTWQQSSLSAEPNSTIWNFATNPADPALIFAYSISGQVFRSTDGGMNWSILNREFGEIRAMAWID